MREGVREGVRGGSSRGAVDWLVGREQGGGGCDLFVFILDFTREGRVGEGQDGWMGGEEREGLGCAVSLTLKCHG